MSVSEAAVMWAPVTAPELAAIAGEQWRRWPATVPLRLTRIRDEAVAEAQRFSQEHGEGHVVRLEIASGLLSSLTPLEAKPVDTTALNAVLGSALMLDAEYLGSVSDRQIRDAEMALGMTFPPAWRDYLQRAGWFRRGWMRTGAYVCLYTPQETVDCMRAWYAVANDRPGMMAIGNDGGGELLTVDARDARTPVTATPTVSTGWVDSIEQTDSLERFVAAIDDGVFDFVFEPRR